MKTTEEIAKDLRAQADQQDQAAAKAKEEARRIRAAADALDGKCHATAPVVIETMVVTTDVVRAGEQLFNLRAFAKAETQA